MNGHEKGESHLEAAAWQIAAATLTHTHPETTKKYGLDTVRRGALPKSLDDIDLGAKEALQGALGVARAIVQAARTLGSTLLGARSPQEAEGLLIQTAVQHLESDPASREASIRVLQTGVAQAFRAKPSLLDVLLGSQRGPPAWVTSPSAWERRIERSVVKVVDQDAGGREIVSTGIPLCPAGHVLTAAHVVGTSDSVQLGFRYWEEGSGQERELRGEADVLEISPRWDLAILKCRKATWEQFVEHGLSPAAAATRPPDELRARRVLCLGYQDPDLFLSPAWATGSVAPWYPVRTVTFRDGHEQPCLVILLHGGRSDRPEVRITEGMSGGPVFDLDDQNRVVVAMVTGATRRVFQEWHGVIEELESAVYGFAVPLMTAAEQAETVRDCCLKRLEV